MSKEKKPQHLRDQALAYLTRREHSRFELSNKLERAGHAPEEIEPLLDEFEARNWLSDRRFAESYVADHRARSGTVKLAYELRQRGVPEAVIEDVISGEHECELVRAREIWSKKFGIPPKSLSDKARQMRFMQSRGFTSDVIRALMSNPGPDKSGDL